MSVSFSEKQTIYFLMRRNFFFNVFLFINRESTRLLFITKLNMNKTVNGNSGNIQKKRMTANKNIHKQTLILKHLKFQVFLYVSISSIRYCIYSL